MTRSRLLKLCVLAAIVGVASLSREGTLDTGTVAWLLALQALQVAAFRACFDVYGTAGYFHKLLAGWSTVCGV